MAKNQTKRQKKVSASLDLINFDENIFYNIFKKLEADTLYNLRVFCKQWYNLILDPHFANSNLPYAEPGILTQTHAHKGYSLRLIKMKEGKVKVEKLNLYFEEPIRASCNGLVLMKDLPEPGDLSVGNLLTRKGTKLPLETCNLPLHNVFGFTHIKETGEYKIVCQMFDDNIGSIVYKILTLGSNEWRQVKGPQLASNKHEPLSINSCVYSLIIDDEIEEEFLFSIDTADETSHKMALPLFRRPTFICPVDCNLMDLGGEISLVAGFVYNGYAEVWVLYNDQEFFIEKEWTMLHRIYFRVERFGRQDVLQFVVPIGSLCNGKLILFVHADNPFGSCYVADMEMKHVVKMLPNVKANRYHCISHLNSLISCQSL
ncbi:uncharacterized protein LOC122651188 [Telopea speciosissima]|uniref:uncharacterized protein LOC122651188 n=1 Tax=Telopea speciosissima TaxID=54955 RepID=UPI001CC3A381|nr:uncharacterized protein LOC122651188 [Telopea speciosissima]